MLQLFLNLFAGLLLINRLHHTENTTANKDENNVIDILLKVKIENSVKLSNCMYVFFEQQFISSIW